MFIGLFSQITHFFVINSKIRKLYLKLWQQLIM